MSETAEEMEGRLRGISRCTYANDLVMSGKDVAAIRYAVRAIEERRELLAVLKTVLSEGAIEEDFPEVTALIDRIEGGK